MNILLFSISILCLVILILIIVLKRLSQPYPVVYILTGVILGPRVTRIFPNSEGVIQLGEIGVLLLMFFLGLEIQNPDKADLL